MNIPIPGHVKAVDHLKILPSYCDKSSSVVVKSIANLNDLHPIFS